MTTRPTSAPSATPGGSGQAGPERPWWSEIDVLLSVVWFVSATIVATLVTSIASVIGGEEIASQPVYAVFFGILAFQLLQMAYPWYVSNRKGLGMEEDWRFVSRLPNDIFYGLSLGVICIIGSQIISLGMAALVGLENASDASNDAILTDNRGSLWLYGVIFLVVVGAPLAEELLFRGLILRILQKSFGSAFAVIASSLMFMFPHWQPSATWQETLVLLSALGTVGVILGIGAVRAGRLGPTVIAHFLFNGAGTLLALA